VEEKGYKSMINLPDWLNIHNICKNLKNRLKTGEFLSSLRAPFTGEYVCDTPCRKTIP
jgi:hypothetical protein